MGTRSFRREANRDRNTPHARQATNGRIGAIRFRQLKLYLLLLVLHLLACIGANECLAVGMVFYT